MPPVPLRSRIAKQRKGTEVNDSNENIELLLRTVISSNPLSIYGAIADLRDEVPKRIGSPGKLAAPGHLAKVDIPTVLPLQGRKFYQCAATEKPAARIRAKSRANVGRPDIIQMVF